ncbi:MAG: hypothetical protein IKE91_06950 [Clostridia bacterium]|nr:hypothetical protein [Clostridia bacterium]
MKIVARVKFTKPQNREFLVQAFYGQEYSPQNRLIVLNDETAVVELWFDNKPPQQIIKSISLCQVDAMYNQEVNEVEEPPEDGNVSEVSGTLATPDDDTEAKAPQKDEETSAETSGDATVPDDSLAKMAVITEEPAPAKDLTSKKKPQENKDKKKEDKTPGMKRRYGAAKASPDFYLTHKQFDILAAKAESYKSFITLVCEWVGLNEEYTDFVVSVILELAKFDQEGYELRNQQVIDTVKSMPVGDYTRVKCNREIQNGLKAKGVLSYALSFYCTLLRYKNEWKEKNDSAESADTDAAADEKKVYTQAEIQIIPQAVETTEEASCYMECAEFAAIIEKIDKSLPMLDRIKILLSEMGLDKKNKILYNNACQIVDAALRMESFESIDEVLQNAGFDSPNKKAMEAKIKFSEWINEYNKTHHIKRMKVIAFLRELKKVFRD